MTSAESGSSGTAQRQWSGRLIRGFGLGTHIPFVALGYAAAIGLASSYVISRPAPVRDAWLSMLSTNLVNLAAHPVRSLVGSAFVTDESPADWVVLAFVGLGVAGRALGGVRLVGLLAAAHLLGTFVSESVVDLQIRSGRLPVADRTMLDVGPSYVVAPALVLGMLYGSTVGRVLAGICFALLAPHLFIGLTRLEVSAVGHVVAIGLAVFAAPALVRDHRARTTALS